MCDENSRDPVDVRRPSTAETPWGEGLLWRKSTNRNRRKACAQDRQIGSSGQRDVGVRPSIGGNMHDNAVRLVDVSSSSRLDPASYRISTQSPRSLSRRPRICAECWGPLPPAASKGRPRLFCSLVCLRRGDRRQRRIRRRRENLELWIALARLPRGERRHSRETCRQMIRELRAEIYVLEQGLRQQPTGFKQCVPESGLSDR